VLKAARELGITVIAYSPLAQGLLSGKFHDRPELIKNAGFRRYRAPFKAAGIGRSRPVIGLLKELAAKYNVTPSQVALNWLIHFHGDTVVAIPGATREQHASENTGAMDFRLSAEDMSALDKISEGFK
jgi:aryl-alcohol dehydrogenase-like predicted oxidoreductase